MATTLAMLLFVSIQGFPGPAAVHGAIPVFTPYTAASETTYSVGTDLMPASAVRDVGSYDTTASWSVGSPSRYRVDEIAKLPVLVSQHQVVVANGKRGVWYQSLPGNAYRVPASFGWFLVDYLQGGKRLLGATSVQQVLAALTRWPWMHAHLAGQQQMLGRTSDVIDFGPLLPPGYPACQGNSKGCPRSRQGWGHGTAWVDDEHAVVLKLRMTGMPADQPQNFLYRVTSIHFGHGPSPRALSYRPPVRLQTIPSQKSNRGSSGPIGPGMPWRPVRPFLTAGMPAGGPGLDGSGALGDSASGATTGVEGLFRDAPGGPYIYIQEHVRESGLPAYWRTMPAYRAGMCRVRLGLYPDGLRWLALARHRVTLLITARGMSRAALQRYAATKICA
ncbi:MAG: hypothetical protein ACRDFX_03700 [Chloroflexota bacterium]